MRATIKVTRAPRLDIPRLTRNETRQVVTVVSGVVKAGISAGDLPNGSPARPLAVRERNGRRSGYAIFKQRKTGRNKRDWNLTGAMMGSLRVTVSDPAVGIIKFGADQNNKAAIRQAQDQMFDISKDAEKAGTEEARKYWDKAVARQNRSNP